MDQFRFLDSVKDGEVSKAFWNSSFSTYIGISFRISATIFWISFLNAISHCRRVFCLAFLNWLPGVKKPKTLWRDWGKFFKISLSILVHCLTFIYRELLKTDKTLLTYVLDAVGNFSLSTETLISVNFLYYLFNFFYLSLLFSFIPRFLVPSLITYPLIKWPHLTSC